jgi:hypothetical protein
MMKRSILTMTVLIAACGDPGGGEDANEFISRVVLTFTPPAGAATTFQFDDPDGDGGAAGTSAPISLAAATYQLTVEFSNALESPPEDITLEVRDEGIEHQVFFTGTAVVGPASSTPSGPLTHSYADTDANGFPVGLTNMVTTAAGSGELIVTLRHMPPEEPPEKSADSAAQVKAGGFAAIGGSTDAQVTFMVTVP